MFLLKGAFCAFHSFDSLHLLNLVVWTASFSFSVTRATIAVSLLFAMMSSVFLRIFFERFPFTVFSGV